MADEEKALMLTQARGYLETFWQTAERYASEDYGGEWAVRDVRFNRLASGGFPTEDLAEAEVTRLTLLWRKALRLASLEGRIW